MELLLIARYIRPHSDILRQFSYRGRYQNNSINNVMLTDNEQTRLYQNRKYMIYIDNAEVHNMTLVGTITRIQEI